LQFWGSRGFVACGKSSSSDDGGGAGASGGGSDCATDADCADPTPKCTEAGECVYENRCDTDADCRGDYKFCDTLGNCEPCRADADCPSETPVCVPGWEFGVYCAVCRGGDSSTCPAGTWCTTDFLPSGGGRCEPAACAAQPSGKPCAACINENAEACLVDGGACEGAHASLDACYADALPGWAPDDCPTGVIPAIRGCTPEACFDEAEAFDACMLACDAVTTLCE
jgi:hypothetical protein